MLLRPVHVCLAACLVAVLLAGCRHTVPRAGAGPAEASDAEMEAKAKAHAHYMAGVLDEMRARPADALDQFTSASRTDPLNTELMLEVTERLVTRQDTARALDLLNRAIATGQASGEIYARQGLVLARMGRTNDAIAACRLAIRKSPAATEAYHTLFVLYAQAHDYNGAHDILDLALKEPSLPSDFLVTLSEMYVSLSRQTTSRHEELRADALHALGAAFQRNPSDPDLRLKIADGFNLLGQPDKAAPIYLDLLKRYPDSPVVRTQVREKLINIYLRGQNRTNAVEQLEAAVRDNPTNPQGYFLLGSLASEQQQMARAADYFRKALLFAPDFEQAYYDLAMAQVQLGDSTNALGTLEKAHAKFGENFVSEFLSGLAYGVATNDTAALRHFTAAELIARATDRQRLNEFLYFQIGVTYYRMGNVDQAVQYLEKSIELAPNFTEALNYLGYLWAERGENLDRARELLERAVRLDPKNAAYLDSLAWALYRLGNFTDALRYQLEAVKYCEPPDPTIYDHLGDIYDSLKKPEDARMAWEKALALAPDNPKIQKKLEATPAP